MKKLLAILLSTLSVQAYANCGNDKGVGNGCSGDSQTGVQGPKGDKGDSGISGVNGTDGINGTNGVNGQDSASSNVSATMGVEVEWLQKGRFSISSGYDYDINKKHHYINGARLNIKIGKSGEERDIDKLRNELSELKRRLSEVVRVQDTFIATEVR